MQRPELLGQGFLADFIVQRSLFALWLPDMCQSGSASQQLWDSIAAQAHDAGQQLTVLGYFPQQEVRHRLRHALDKQAGILHTGKSWLVSSLMRRRTSSGSLRWLEVYASFSVHSCLPHAYPRGL